MSGAPYIVWSPEGETPPKISYETHGHAHKIALIMAEKHPGRQFLVMGRCGKGARVEAQFCSEHPDQLAVANLDGAHQCQLCAEAWVRAEGDAEIDAKVRAEESEAA